MSATEKNKKNINLLLVDDDEVLRDIVAEALKIAGIFVQEAVNLTQAKELLELSCPHIILADVIMPQGTGIDLLKWIRQQKLPLKDVPVILMTGYANFEIAKEALNLGTNHLLQKPFRPSETIQIINKLVGDSRRRQQDIGYKKAMVDYNEGLIKEVCERQMAHDKLYLGVIISFTKAIDARDPYTCNHSTTVSELCFAMGRAMHLPAAEQEILKTAAQFHDIGKIAVPEAILRKPGKLTDAEFSIMRTHPEKGEKILAALPDLENAMPGIRSHHERFDGKGYPDGLAGDAIPLIARIISICDTWNAMRTDRPYRQALSIEKSLSIIEAGRGSQFDDKIVDAFLELLEHSNHLL